MTTYPRVLSLPLPQTSYVDLATMADALEHEARVRELIQLFSRERDPEKLKLLAAELQQLLKVEGTPPKTVRNRIKKVSR